MNTNLKQLSDESLMKLYQKGDEMAFETLYTRHSPKIYSFLTKKVGDSTLASDLLQEVFFKLHHSRNSFNSEYPFLPWIFTISKNVIIDSMRKSKRTIHVQPMNEEVHGHGHAHERREDDQIDLIQSALTDLPQSQKAAITLRYLEDWTFEDIAKSLKTSPANSRKLVSRGIKNIKDVFSKNGESK